MPIATFNIEIPIPTGKEKPRPVGCPAAVKSGRLDKRQRLLPAITLRTGITGAVTVAVAVAVTVTGVSTTFPAGILAVASIDTVAGILAVAVVTIGLSYLFPSFPFAFPNFVFGHRYISLSELLI